MDEDLESSGREPLLPHGAGSGSSKRSSHSSRSPSPRRSLRSSLTQSLTVDAPAQAGSEGPGNSAQTSPVPFHKLFRFASRDDKICVAVGSLSALCAGVIPSIFARYFGRVMDDLHRSSSTADAAAEVININEYARLFMYLSFSMFVLTVVTLLCFGYSSERQAGKMKLAYLNAVLLQDVEWYDTSIPSELATRIKGDTILIGQGIGVQLALLIRLSAQLMAGFGVGFSVCWRIALVMLSVVPVILLAMACIVGRVRVITTKCQREVAAGGSVAKEVLSGIKMVKAFTGEVGEIDRYGSILDGAASLAIAGGSWLSAGMGAMMFMMFSTYAAGMLYGAHLIARDETQQCTGDGCITPGDVLTVFWGILQGAVAVTRSGPSLSAIAKAQGAAADLFATIERVPPQDRGLTPKSCAGEICFEDVYFSYPSHPTPVLQGFSLSVVPGQVMAIIGASGGGKSTALSLLERFYRPTKGRIYLDGVDIKTLSRTWLREQIGLVLQEPLLFSVSIRDNIAYGKAGASQEEVVAAAKLANAHSFIASFPEGYDTLVGDAGRQLSGGQRQRVALARAIIKSPAILLLDEATHALDCESELHVQSALQQLKCKGATIVVVAHRMSTIAQADIVAVMKAGKVVQLATPEDLNLAGICLKSDGVKAEGNDGASCEELGLLPAALAAEDKEPEVLAAPAALAASETLKRLRTLAQPEQHYLWIAMTGAFCCGIAYPVLAVLLSSVIRVLYNTPSNEIMDKALLWTGAFISIAAFIGGSTALQLWGFIVQGYSITNRLRLELFEGMLHQNMEFFDDPANSVGALLTRLAVEPALVSGIAGMNQVQTFQAITPVILVLLLLALAGDLRLALLLAAMVPCLGGAALLQKRALVRSATLGVGYLAQAGGLLSEIIGGLRTVAACNLRARLCAAYGVLLSKARKEAVYRALIIGVTQGLTQLLSLFGYAVIFWYGGHKVIAGEMDFHRMLMGLMSVMLVTQGIGQLGSTVGSAAIALDAANRVFTIVDGSVEGRQGKSLPGGVKGEVDFVGVSFSYPSRKGKILDGFNLSLRPGSIMALVGASGGGKSTVCSLLERFYMPQEGCITIDGVDIKTLSRTWLREQIGLVLQEPLLFSVSIRDNIAYGRPGASAEQVMGAALMANAHSFIEELPHGYDTLVGDEARLSGGQKQRVALARALLKDPQILVLDEATSAVDHESEEHIQDILQQEKQRRKTILVIAHRTSTIANADSVAVMENGRVVELGSESELAAAIASSYRRMSVSLEP